MLQSHIFMLYNRCTKIKFFGKERILLLLTLYKDITLYNYRGN